jgi:[acyl-carrier-protein] S-malonyltransferase
MNNLAFLFTGQGSQHAGMAKSLYNEFEIARRTFEEASDVLGFDMAALCFKGGLGTLSKPQNAPLAVLTSSVTSYRVFMNEIGIEPQYCAGHSLGEYSALTCAGAINFSDALKIVRERGILINEIIQQNIGTMTIVDGIDESIVEEHCKKVSIDGKVVVINCYNNINQVTVAGHKRAVEELEDIVAELGAHVTPLMMSAPIHTQLMNEKASKLKKILTGYTFNPLKYSVVSNISADAYSGPQDIVERLTCHMLMPVRWKETVNNMYNQGVTTVIEMGPRNILCNMVKSYIPAMEAFFYDKGEDLKNLQNNLKSC